MSCVFLKAKTLILAAGLLFLACCSGTGDLHPDSEPVVTVLFDDGGLGDLGYQDNIFESLCRIFEKSLNDCKFRMEVYIPETEDELSSTMHNWLSKEKSSPELLVSASYTYADYVSRHIDALPDGLSEMLFLDCNTDNGHFYSRYIPLYGTGYYAGLIVRHLGIEKAAVILANKLNKPIYECYEGFRDGFSAAGGHISDSDLYYLDYENNSGYADAKSAYVLSSELEQKGYKFILPVCGGSAQGVFHYTRSHNRNVPDEQTGTMPFFTCGVDVDQGKNSAAILFSMLKKYDAIIEEFISDWLHGIERERCMRLTLDSGYEDIVWSLVNPGLMPAEEDMDAMRGKAVKAELSYYKNHD